MTSNLRTLVIYHANCPDGFTAAWALWKKFGNAAEYKPANYGQPPHDIRGFDKVIIADFSYSRPILEAMAERVELVVLDHHKTAQQDLSGLPFAKFDMNKSGARLAWEWAHGKGFVPQIVLYAEDRDLWRWAMPKSREISQWMRMQPYTFDSWSVADKQLQDDSGFWEAAAIGESLLAFQDQQVDIMAKRAVLRVVGGHIVPVANATVFFSEVGERMCELNPAAPFSAYYFDLDQESRQWGMRSRGDFDCSAVAKELGGGGHPGASGFVTHTQFQFPTKDEIA